MARLNQLMENSLDVVGPLVFLAVLEIAQGETLFVSCESIDHMYLIVGAVRELYTEDLAVRTAENTPLAVLGKLPQDC